jgi:hypothetical protein
VCIQAAHAVPREGVHTGPSIDVAYANLTGSVGGCTCPSDAAVKAGGCLCPPNSPLQNCSCPVVIVEAIQGSLAPAAGPPFTSFTGKQIVHVRPLVDPLPGPICDCQIVCSYSYALTAKTVGTP